MTLKIQKSNLKPFILPIIIWFVGIIVCSIFAPKTTYVNAGVGIGFLIMCIGTFYFFFEIYKEFDRLDLELPSPLHLLFARYPVVPDVTKLHEKLSGFRKFYNEFLGSNHYEENSSIQSYASQILWHSLYLQKKRIQKFHITMNLASKRRAYSPVKTAVTEKSYFDGRYEVNDVKEEISSVRTFFFDGKEVYSQKYNEIAHYTLLSAKQVGENEVICPNCGATTTRDNLIDGCDFCGTKFTVEDMQNRISSFGFRRDFETSENKRKEIMHVIFPWILLIIELPMFYFGMVGSFIYGAEDTGILLKFITGLFAGGLLVLLGWCLVKLCSIGISLAIYLFGASWSLMNKKLLIRSDEDVAQEKSISKFVRDFDPHFSLQSFFGSVQDKLYAIHFANTISEINALTEADLSSYLPYYSDVIGVDTETLRMDQYKVIDDVQIADVTASLNILHWNGKKITSSAEKLHLKLIKSKNCKTQAVCAASVLRCHGCGTSLSLLDGKYCPSCGRALDLKLHDWVISYYEIL